MTMKLRIRRSKQTTLLTLDDNQGLTLGYLKGALAERFTQCSREGLSLSLNGQTVLEGADDSNLVEHGIVSGDLIHILLPVDYVPEQVEAAQTGRTKHHNPQENDKAQDDDQDSIKDSNKSHLMYQQSCGTEQTESHVAKETTPSTQGEPSRSRSKGEEQNPHVGSSDSNVAGACFEAQPQAAEEPEFEDEPDAIRDGEVNRYLQEPVSIQECQDGTVTDLLRRVYIAAAPSSPAEAVCIMLHTLMVESGFLPLPVGTAAEQLPAGWRTPSAFRLNYRHPADGAIALRLICVTLGQTLVTHGSAEGGADAAGLDARCKCQLKIKPRDFIRELTPDVTLTYRNLPLLSRLFKDAISFRLLQSIQTGDQPLVFSLQTMPMEIKLSILRYLDVLSLAQMCSVSCDMRATAGDSVLWRRLYLIHFGRRGRNDLDQDWKNMYRDKYVIRQRMREQFRRRTQLVPPFVGRPHPLVPSVPVYPPGFIGGDYDLNPDFGLRDPFGRHGQRILQPPRPRIDPFGPLPSQRFPPGRGGGMFDRSNSSARMRGFPKFF